MMQEIIELGDRESHQQEVLIFLHIMKAGGTTLNGIINQQYRRNSIVRINGINNRNQIQDMPESRRKEIKLIRGHFAFGLHYFLDCQATYFTMVREPIGRFMSNFYYQQQRSNDKIFKQLSLEDFVWLKGQEQSNAQTKMLCGITQRMESCKQDNMLEIAKYNIDNYFSSIGILERFDESLVIFKRKYNWNFPVYLKQNKSINKPKNNNLSKEAIKALEKYNAMDIELYKYVSQKFQRQVESYGKSFEQELRLQNHFNKIYQPLGRLYNIARHQYFKYAWRINKN